MYVLTTYALALWQVVAVDWAASSLRQEGDVIIQAILQAIVKLAIECWEYDNYKIWDILLTVIHFLKTNFLFFYRYYRTFITFFIVYVLAFRKNVQ